jgi:hypothetical protein
VNEGSGKFNIRIQLDRPANGNITIFLETSGTAADTFDYDLVKSVTIPAGQTVASVEFQPYVDLDVDPDEEAIISFKSVSGSASLSQDNITITLEEFEDEVILDLTWRANNGNTPGDVDLDILFWVDDGAGGYDLFAVSDNIGTTFEALAIPTPLLPDGTYALSFLYFEGTSNDVDFSATFTPLGTTTVDGFDSPAEYTATYTLDNLFDPLLFPLFEQFGTINGLDFSLSDITVPSEGSRAPKGKFRKMAVKSKKYSLR